MLTRFDGFPTEGDPAAAEVRHLAVGFFDGLHLGHRAVIVHEANRHELAQTCVLSFWPHPSQVLNPGAEPQLLTGLSAKLAVLDSWGVGATSVVPFDLALAQRRPDWFLDRLGSSFPNLKSLSVGPNFRFGFRRSGTPVTLAAWAAQRALEFHLTDYVLEGGMPVSSTRIRAALAAGDLAAGERMLGRRYALNGVVKTGDGRGRLLGFPTANLETEMPPVVPSGVYFGITRFEDEKPLPCALNIGTRPTVDPTATGRSVEIHLLDWSGDCYGQRLTCELVHWQRPEQQFNGLESLRCQINDDITACRCWWRGLSDRTGQVLEATSSVDDLP